MYIYKLKLSKREMEMVEVFVFNTNLAFLYKIDIEGF